MALQRTIVEVPLSGGVETKVDPKLVPPGSMLVMENAEFDVTGAASKRNGFSALSTSKLGGGSISAGRTLHEHDGALVMHDGSSLCLWEPAQAKWLNVGALGGVSAAFKPLPNRPADSFHTTIVPTTAQTALVNNALVYCARDPSSAPIFGAIDATTGAVLVAPTSAATGLTSLETNGPVRIAVGGSIVAMVFERANIANNLCVVYIDTSSPTAFSGRTIATDINVDGRLDVAALSDGDDFVVVYENTTPAVKLLKFTTAGGAGSSATIAEDPDSKHIGVVVSAAGHINLAWRRQSTNRPRAAVYNNSLVAVVAATDLSTSAGADQFAGVEESANTVRWMYSLTASSQRRVVSNTVTSSGSVGTEASVVRGAWLASKPFVYSGTTYVAVGYTSGNSTAIQSGYYLVTSSGFVVARYLSDAGITEGQCANSLPAPSSVVNESSGVYIIGLGYNTTTALSIDTYYSQPGYVRLDFSARHTSAQLGGSLLLANGGLVSEFDGGAVFENGFFVYPEPISLSQTGSGSLADGTYQVTALYAYLDIRGQIHFGPAAPPVSIAVSGGGGTASITVTVPNLRMTNRSRSMILIYVTESLGNTFYEAITLANSKTTDTTSAAVITSVADITDNRILYTQGGILENNAPPPLSSLVRKGRRIYGMAQDGVLYYTKEHVEGEAAAFVSETLVRRLFEDGGESYRVAEMDGRVIAFGARSIQVLQGEGLDDTGSSDTLGDPQQIPTDTGSIPGAPTVLTPIGLFYKSKAGIRLLDRSLQANDTVGKAVESYNDLTLVSAVVVPGKRQIRFGHSDGSTLVYDYGANQWAVFTNHAQVSAVVWGDDYCLLKSDGTVWQQGAGFTDGDSASISNTIETPWIKLAGLQGFQRLYYVSVLGEWRSDHTLTLKVYYDYDPDVAETRTFTATTAAQGYASGDPLQVRHHLGRKCQAVKFRLEESDQAGTKESARWSALALDIGGVGGIFRQPSSRTI